MPWRHMGEYMYRHYIVFLIPAFIVQMTKLVQFTFSKIKLSTSVHFATRVRTWCVARLSGPWRSFMQAITFTTWLSSSSVAVIRIHFSFYTLLSSNPVNKNLMGLGLEILVASLWTATTDPPIRESVIEMLHHKSSMMRRGSVMLKIQSNPCLQGNSL
jgi:hypothetical protein